LQFRLEEETILRAEIEVFLSFPLQKWNL